MNKYTAIVQKPCNVLAEFARQRWEQATPENNPEYFMIARIVVVGEAVYMHKPKHQRGIMNPTTAGGKWEKVQRAVIAGYGGPAAWLEYIRATPAEFKGGPRL